METKEDFTPNSSATIDGKSIETYKTCLENFNIIEVEAGTTGPMGGDSGHGCRTYFRIEDLASTDMRCRVHSDDGTYEFDHIERIELMFGGDSELDTFREALRIGYEVLKQR